MPGEDETLAYLLDLDGEEIIYDGGYVARFTVKRITATPEKPHGVSYSLTFHAADGRRLSAEKLIADFFDEIARILEERNDD